VYFGADRATREPSLFHVSALRASVTAMALCLVGCGSQAGENAQFSHTDTQLPSNAYMRVWSDPDTGCRYYIYQEGGLQYAIGGMTIRFRADGTADCPSSGASKK
jgi:hypothetical protein